MIQSLSSDLAAWVQAVGTIAAVVGAGWLAARDSRASRRREDQAGLAAKNAAVNLAVLAATQIHDLHLLLRDEARRGRIEQVSPSRSLLVTQRLLTAYPIQSLGDAVAMVAFARFPGALATAAEIYANLERAVRRADETDHGAIFAEYGQQMAALDAMAKARLKDLRDALKVEADG